MQIDAELKTALDERRRRLGLRHASRSASTHAVAMAVPADDKGAI